MYTPVLPLCFFFFFSYSTQVFFRPSELLKKDPGKRNNGMISCTAWKRYTIFQKFFLHFSLFILFHIAKLFFSFYFSSGFCSFCFGNQALFRMVKLGICRLVLIFFSSFTFPERNIYLFIILPPTQFIVLLRARIIS